MKIGGVYNVRDIGGAKTRSGKRVREGLIYRSGNLNSISKKGKVILKNELGIRSDLDLRRKGEGGAGKKSAAGLKYIHISSKAYEGVYQKKSGRKALIKSMKVFTKEKNYPVLFHCVAGRDRTGTLAMVLEGILGMKKKDIFRDYELTYLSKHSNKSSYSFEYNVTHYLCDNGMTKDEIRYIRNLMLE
ncbi:MAG: tyrosine-protein phosphatase [Mogibacterium sp.]|nr:tyrosine-protein phosphatase [Mogibacterium sp.]